MHVAVLQKEVLDALDLKVNSVVVDATYGGGGHAKLICKALGKSGVYVGIDADETAFISNPMTVDDFSTTIHLVNDNFSNLDQILSSLNIKKVDAILADLGWRTDQFVSGGKGFSFLSEEPLIMTFGKPESYLFTAHDIINNWSEEDIANVLYGYGDERYSRRISRAIVESRKESSIETAKQLADIITRSLPKHLQRKPINPATKSFQALRIAVNDELKKLESFIEQSADRLSENGRLAIISFHSIEDRIVKLMFRDLVSNGEFELVTKKPISASPEELLQNPKARSAKLRIIKKIKNQSLPTNYYEQ